MRLVGWLALLVSCLGLLGLGTACRPRTYPGTSAGNFAVTQTLTTNTCAGGFDPDATLQYDIDIRVEGTVAYWHRGDTPVANGTYAADGHFHFVSSQDVVAYGTDAGTGPGCILRQTETIDGMLALGVDAGAATDDDDAGAGDAQRSPDASADAGPDAGVRSSGFTGTDAIQIAIAPGSDCSLLFAPNGGPFSALPCTATYEMSGTAR